MTGCTYKNAVLFDWKGSVRVIPHSMTWCGNFQRFTNQWSASHSQSTFSSLTRGISLQTTSRYVGHACAIGSPAVCGSFCIHAALYPDVQSTFRTGVHAQQNRRYGVGTVLKASTIATAIRSGIICTCSISMVIVLRHIFSWRQRIFYHASFSQARRGHDGTLPRMHEDRQSSVASATDA